jgi:hypothetical protein
MMKRSTLVGDDPPAVNDGFAFSPTPETTRIADALYDGNKAVSDQGDFPTLTSAIDRRLPELFVRAGVNAAAQQQLRATFVDIAARTQLPDVLVERIADSHITDLLAAARVVDDPDAADGALDQQIAQWNTTSREEFPGPEGAALLARTQKFVRAHPALAKILQTRGLGSRPDIVKAISEHVFSTGYR